MDKSEGGKNKCLVCDETRCLERAHTVPVSLFSLVFKKARRRAYMDKAIVILCPTHHRCFDADMLTDAEAVIIYGEVKRSLHLVSILVDNFDKVHGIIGDSKIREKHRLRINSYIKRVGRYV